MDEPSEVKVTFFKKKFFIFYLIFLAYPSIIQAKQNLTD